MGIDRLTMFLTNNVSIREVLLFPAMKPILENTKNADNSGADTSSSVNFEDLEKRLSNTPFLAGRAFGDEDLSVKKTIGTTDVDPRKFPKVSAWMKLMSLSV